MRRADVLAVLSVWILALGLAALTSAQAIDRYRAFQTGWSWDLAYYNQWFWSLTQGDGVLSVRPVSSFAIEGPPAWKSNYLAPVRLLILPLYALRPDPTTLLILQNVVFWWILPAAYGLVRSETGAWRAGVAAVPLVCATPLLWPLVANDFRELQLALPFVIVAVRGVRSRSIFWSAVGISGMLACRQELALAVASLAMLPARDPQPLPQRYRWTCALSWLGLGWFVIGYFGYLSVVVGSRAPEHYLGEFGGPRPAWLELAATALSLAILGMGPWVVLAAAKARAAILILPWLWSLAAGRWALAQLGTEQWHHVRYAAPFVAMALAIGLVGYAACWNETGRWRATRALRLTLWILAIGLGLGGCWAIQQRMARIPHPIGRDEAAQLRRWIAEVQPEDGVLAHYDVTAPLSSRRRLVSYVLEVNRPPGYPDRLPPEIRWVFARSGDLDPDVLLLQGFTEVASGPHIRVYRR